MTGRHYSSAFKTRVVQRALVPGGPTVREIAKEVGVPEGTICRWRAEAGTVDDVSKKRRPPPEPSDLPPEPDRHPRSTREWPPGEKLRILGAAAQLKDEELGEFLRREGLHEVQLDEWRGEMLTALGQAPAARRDLRAQRLEELERELARKDKALAEVTALLVLRKKLTALFDDNSAEEGDSTDEKYGKK
jgi:transposase